MRPKKEKRYYMPAYLTAENLKFLKDIATKKQTKQDLLNLFLEFIRNNNLMENKNVK